MMVILNFNISIETVSRAEVIIVSFLHDPPQFQYI